jgi:hypothetical protein
MTSSPVSSSRKAGGGAEVPSPPFREISCENMNRRTAVVIRSAGQLKLGTGVLADNLAQEPKCGPRTHDIPR